VIFLLLIAISILFLISSALFFYKWGLIAIFLFVPLIVYLAFNPSELSNLSLVIMPLVIGGVGGYVFLKRKSFTLFLMVSTVLVTLFFSVGYYSLLTFKNVDLIAQSKQQTISLMKSFMGKQLKFSKNEQKKNIENLEGWFQVLKDVFVFNVFLNVLFITLLSWAFLDYFFYKFKGVPKLEGLESFKVNDYFIFVLIISWLFSLFFYETKNSLLYLVGLNVALISTLLYVVQALGIISFFIKKRGRRTTMFFILLFLSFFMGIEVVVFISIILAGVGALDLWADFRKLNLNVDKSDDTL